VYITAATIFALIPFAIGEDKLPVKSHDGSIGYYRLSVMNFYLIASDETYNAHYSMFFFAEGLSTCMLVLTFIIFDILLVTLCVGICCQMQMISSAFELVGYKSPRDHNPPLGKYDFQVTWNTRPYYNVSVRVVYTNDFVYYKLKVGWNHSKSRKSNQIKSV